MDINYNHQQNIHTADGATTALPLIFNDWKPNSLLDVGCGLGTWLKAALNFGISDVLGIDGIDIPVDRLLVSSKLFKQQNLTVPWSLGRRFDAVICLEVAEHLEDNFANNLVQTLTYHSDVIIFSAAPPWQSGQQHVNCQLPSYWQALFNQHGFVCSDAVRWRLWDIPLVEPWYKQNMFIANRNLNIAGREERIRPIIHPDLLTFILSDIGWINPDIETKNRLELIQQIENGSMPIAWYFSTLSKALLAKIGRRNFNKSAI